MAPAEGELSVEVQSVTGGAYQSAVWLDVESALLTLRFYDATGVLVQTVRLFCRCSVRQALTGFAGGEPAEQGEGERRDDEQAAARAGRLQGGSMRQQRGGHRGGTAGHGRRANRVRATHAIDF